MRNFDPSSHPRTTMTLLLWLSALTIAVVGFASASEDSELMADVCDDKLHQLAKAIRTSAEDVLTESVELALTVFSRFRAALLRSKSTLKASASSHRYPFLRSSSRSAAPHLTSISVDLESLYVALTKTLKLRKSDKQHHSFTSAMAEINAEYLKACFSAGPKPTLESLSRDLAAARVAGDDKRKEYLFRSVFAKATCFEKRVAKIQTSAADFFKSITSNEAKDIFGFHFDLKKDNFPALAFVIDTTGSMAPHILTATNVIGEFIKHEQQNPFFYVLTPFNDYDEDGSGRPNYGPNTIATTRDDLGPAAKELDNLYNAVKNLNAHSGGDLPEYCMSGIIEAFKATYTTTVEGEPYPLHLFANGSQIIVITDATAKDAEKKSEVIRLAVGSDTEINFLLTSGVSHYSVYREIAEATRGVVSTIVNGDELKTLTDFASNRIAAEGAKREGGLQRLHIYAGPGENCVEFRTSSFTSNVNGFVSSDASSVLVTSPDGVAVRMSSNTVFNRDLPQPGRWKICVPTGNTLNANLESRTEINFAVSFLVENSSRLVVAKETPSVCTNGKLLVTFLDDSASKISSSEPLYLDFLSDTRKVVATATLLKCDEILTGSILYPKEAVAFLSLRGLDTLGNSFEYTTKEPRSLSFVGPSKLRFETTEPVSVPVPVTSNRDFAFTLLTDSDGQFNINISFSSTSSHLFLTPRQPATVLLKRIVVVSVSVLVKASAPLNEVISFDVKATYKNCDVGASYTQRISVSPSVGPVDQCGGCKNGGTCKSILGKNRCFCRPGYIGIFCQTEISPSSLDADEWARYDN